MSGIRRETFEDVQLISGRFPYHSHVVTVESGQNLSRGAVLGKVTASGKYKLSASAATDGSQTAVVILAEDVDATSADTDAIVLITASVVADALIYGEGHTQETVWESLAANSIYIIEVL
ncbi:MAG: head decoration protein [Deferribacterales bacterium]